MHRWKSLLSALLLAIVLSNLAGFPVAAMSQYAAESITGSYLLDNRPEELWFLSLTQVGQSVNGYAIVVEPDEDSALSQQQLPLSGTTDGTNLAITIGDSWFGMISMSGTSEGGDLVLNFPTDAGGIGTAVFARSSPEAFNQAFVEWQNMGVAQDWLNSVLLTEADMPSGMLFAYESSLSLSDVVSAYSSLDQDQLAEWGWLASVDRSFNSTGSVDPSDELQMAVITLHQFGTVEGAASALDGFISSDQNTGWEISHSDGATVALLTLPSSGNGIIPDGVDIIVYLQLADTIAQIRGFAFGGDPTAETLEIARRLYDPAYRATAQELSGHIYTMETAAAEVDDLERSVQTELDDMNSVVDTLSNSLVDLENQANEALDCFALESLIFSYENGMAFTYENSLVWEQDQYEDAEDAMDAAVNSLESSPAIASQTLATLTTMRALMPAPLNEASDLLFDQEQSVIDATTLRAVAARETLNDLHAEYEEAITSAETIMADGSAIVEGAEQGMSC